MFKTFVAATAVLASVSSASAAVSTSEAARLSAAGRTVQDIRNEIPSDYWGRAHCVVVIPDLKKAAFIVGGEYGRGVMSCRADDQWSAPAFMEIAKGSWGFQAGVEQVDLVLLVMNEQGARKLLQNKTNLGADASVAAGPIGRRGGASTDAALSAEILSYSRSHGLFAGIDISGGMLRPDEDSNIDVYGRDISPRTILTSREIAPPAEARAFLNALGAAASPSTTTANMAPSSTPATPHTTTMPTTDDDLRARVVDIQQTLDRLLAETTPAPVGTSGTAGQSPAESGAPDGSGSPQGSRPVTIDRVYLLKLRAQLDALIAGLNRR
jgi:lipid-binding SYLF domain-containing protein